MKTDIAFLMFLVGPTILWFATLYLTNREGPSLRNQLLWVSSYALCGALVVGAWHRIDFWNPVSVLGYPAEHPFLTIEDLLFGGLFAGPVAVWSLLKSEHYLVVERSAYRQVPRKKKVVWVFAPAVVGLTLFLAGANSVVACSVLFLSGTVMVCYWRRDLVFLAIKGSLFTTLGFSVLVGAFLLKAPNRLELAESMCQFYVRHGALWTGVVLTFWALTFGAWINVLYPFVTNRRYETF